MYPQRVQTLPKKLIGDLSSLLDKITDRQSVMALTDHFKYLMLK